MYCSRYPLIGIVTGLHSIPSPPPALYILYDFFCEHIIDPSSRSFTLSQVSCKCVLTMTLYWENGTLAFGVLFFCVLSWICPSSLFCAHAIITGWRRHRRIDQFKDRLEKGNTFLLLEIEGLRALASLQDTKWFTSSVLLSVAISIFFCTLTLISWSVNCTVALLVITIQPPVVWAHPLLR